MIQKKELKDVNNFTTLYRRAIKYFTFTNDQHFKEYMNKMKFLLCLERVD